MPEPLPALLPCPFCGGEAQRIGGNVACVPRCSNEDCPAGPCVTARKTQADADAVWNTRATARNVLVSLDGEISHVRSRSTKELLSGYVFDVENGADDALQRLSEIIVAMCLNGNLEDGLPVSILVERSVPTAKQGRSAHG